MRSFNDENRSWSQRSRWFDFGYENTYDDPISLDTVGSLYFDRQEYERLLVQF
jgi:hypothetical protein